MYTNLNTDEILHNWRYALRCLPFATECFTTYAVVIQSYCKELSQHLVHYITELQRVDRVKKLNPQPYITWTFMPEILFGKYHQIYATFENNFRLKITFTKYLKGSSWLGLYQHLTRVHDKYKTAYGCCEH